MAERKQKKMCQSLRSILELMAILKERKNVMEKVIQIIKEKVDKYVQNAAKFFASFDSSKGFLQKTIDLSADFLEMLAGDEYKYDTYNDDLSEEINDCVKALEDNIFGVYACSAFLVFMCSTAFKERGGGQWNGEYLNGTKTEQNLYHWLIDKERKKNDRIMRRGFKSGTELKSLLKGSDLVSDDTYSRLGTPYGSFILLIGDVFPGMIHFALQYMLFIGKWHSAKCGNTVLFLDAFCFKVIGRLFHDVDMEETINSLSVPCQNASSSIASLLQQIGVESRFPYPFYTNWLDNRSPSTYVTWLKKHIPKLITSLDNMKQDCKNWSQENLKKGKTQGPFPWGFVFISMWDDGKTKKLQECIAKVTKSLKELQEAINKLPPHTGEVSEESIKAPDLCEDEEQDVKEAKVEENRLPQEQEQHPDTKTHIVLSPAAKTGVTSGVIGAGAIGAAGYVIYSHAATAKNLVVGLFSCFVK